MKKSSARGASTSREFEVLALTPHALWICVRGREHMLDYGRFPWFRNANIEDVERCELRFDHLYWPRLDVDLHLDSLEDPGRFPLVSKVAVRPAKKRGAGHSQNS